MRCEGCGGVWSTRCCARSVIDVRRKSTHELVAANSVGLSGGLAAIVSDDLVGGRTDGKGRSEVLGFAALLSGGEVVLGV